MAIASLFGVVALPIILIGVLLPVALVVALQVWLCKRKNRWLGLILPGLSLLLSLAMLLSVGVFSHVGTSVVSYDEHGTVVEEHHEESHLGVGAETFALMGVNFLINNIPTVVLGGIWLHYKNRRDLSADQAAWLEAHPDFDWEKECEEAKKVAEAIKADGWNFASHTWGHIRIGDASLEHIQTDTERWLQDVAPLIGGTDTIIFAHGQDLADWHDYQADNEKFNYLKSKGFNIYCNVDSTQYFVQCRDNYLRMGRRNLDGYRLYQDAINGGTRTSDLFDAASVWDSRRPTDPSLYDLQ